MDEASTPRVRRGRRNSSYTAISNALIDHPTLSPEARLVLIYLLSKPDDWQLQVGDIRRLLGTGGQPCGRNKAYDVIRELKASAYVVAHEELLRGRFHRLTYYVFDEPLADPEAFLRSLRTGSEPDAPAHAPPPEPPCPQIRETVKTPCPQNGETVAPPCPQFRDPENGHITKYGKKQITEPPPPSPSGPAAPAGAGTGGGGISFSRFWAEWPETSLPREQGLAEKLFEALPPEDRIAAVTRAADYRKLQRRQGSFSAMIPYLRERKFAAFEDAPPFTPDGYFRITPDRAEWGAWTAHLRGQLSEATLAKQEKLGFLLVKTRWPASPDVSRRPPQALVENLTDRL